MDTPDMIGEGMVTPARFTVAQYHQMIDAGVLGEDDRVELVEGVIVQRSPQEPPHARAISALNRILSRGLDLDRWSVRVQLPLTLERSEPEPDVAVVSREVEASSVRHPGTAALVIEVSGESLRMDRRVKAALYAQARVPEYWVVDVAGRKVEVFTRPGPEGQGYLAREVRGAGERIRSAATGVDVEVAELFPAGS